MAACCMASSTAAQAPAAPATAARVTSSADWNVSRALATPDLRRPTGLLAHQGRCGRICQTLHYDRRGGRCELYP